MNYRIEQATLSFLANVQQRPMNRKINLVAAAFMLTALSYGLARFAYGLFLPQIREELSLGMVAAGWIAGSAFAAYCLGIILAFCSSARLSARSIALSAGIAATVGMALVALARSEWSLGLGIALAGLSTGLTSPPLATAVGHRFAELDRPKANAVINAGTAAGIIFSGLAALTVAGAWRELYAVFALLGAGVSAWLWFAVPASATHESSQRISFTLLRRPGLLPLCVGALLMGVSSTAVWSFGANILRGDFDFGAAQIAWTWIALGIAGLGGSVTGLLTNRFGTRRVLAFALLAMAAGTLGLVTASLCTLNAFVAISVFGAAYIIATGVYLIQGIDLLPDRPDLGLGIPFLVLALGQAAGAPLFGGVQEVIGTTAALALFSAVACLAIVFRPQADAANALRTGSL